MDDADNPDTNWVGPAADPAHVPRALLAVCA